MLDQALHAANGCGLQEHPGGGAQLACCIRAALEPDREKAAKTARHLTRGDGMARMAFQTRIEHMADRLVLAQGLRELRGSHE